VITISILYAILIFGALIFIHEFGHYITARIFKVGINEFAIGMGPKLFSHRSEKTNIVYSLRLLPIGGFVSMVGEDEDVFTENSINSKPVWQRMIVTAAGSFMNILLGFVLMFVMVLATPAIGSTTVAEFIPDATSSSYGLTVGDVIKKVDGASVHTSLDLSYEIMRRGVNEVDLTVERNGTTVVIPDVRFPGFTAEGIGFGDMDFKVYRMEKTVPNIIYASFHQSIASIKIVWESLFDLVSGKYGIEQMSGPVGVTQSIGDAAKAGTSSLLYLCTVIAMNLGVFNLIPFPALDGGRIFFMLIELVRGKPLSQKVEGFIHFAGIILLMALMLLITVKDVFKLFG